MEDGEKRGRRGTVPLGGERAVLSWLERGGGGLGVRGTGRWRSCRHCSVWAEPEGGGEGRAGAAASAARPLGQDAAAARALLTFRAEEEEEEGALRELGGC